MGTDYFSISCSIRGHWLPMVTSTFLLNTNLEMKMGGNLPHLNMKVSKCLIYLLCARWLLFLDLWMAKKRIMFGPWTILLGADTISLRRKLSF